MHKKHRMIKNLCRHLSFLMLFPIFFIWSCSNEIDIYADFSPKLMVYCQVDPSDSSCLVTLSKSFQTDSDTYQTFISGESLLVENAEINLEVWGDGFKAWETGFTLLDKLSNNTSFSVKSRSIYESNKTLNFLDPTSFKPPQPALHDHLRLIITAPEFDQIIYSKITIPDAPKIEYPLTPVPLSLYGVEESYFLFIIKDKKIEYLDFVCDFYYKEFVGEWIDRKVQLIIKENLLVQDSVYIRIFEDQFFNKLARKIDNNPETNSRKFDYMDFSLLFSDEYFYDYYSTYEGRDDSDQSLYSNITNGSGLFTIRKKSDVKNIVFDPQTFDSLCNGRLAKHLNFRDW